MKKSLTIFLIVVMISSCAINDGAGLISIRNLSSKGINLSIGDVKNYIGAGGKYDYWFYKSFSGNVDGNYEYSLPFVASFYNDVSGDVEYKQRGNATFKTNYKYDIDIIGLEIQTGYFSYDTAQIIFIREGKKNGSNGLIDDTSVHYPGK
ncbi:MAG TPA: hypothetical protein PK771_05160 [Spirochaetota bacterium]|nr:hypothetical protein [Spirochaetota bacterium]